MRKALLALALFGVVGATVPAFAGGGWDKDKHRDRGLHRGFIYGMPRGQYYKWQREHGKFRRHAFRHQMRRHHRNFWEERRERRGERNRFDRRERFERYERGHRR